MKRTISVMVGKGSVNHNSRKFKAANVDGERTHLNIDYCNENIRDVYHEMFDSALEAYNAKQTRSDRRIPDYYEKIRSSKQEKLFHEVILQIGNCDDTGATTETGQEAKLALDEYYQGFQERNPNLRVFSAHLHMDEATPHLHIDFVPFTTGSKRGLETRVSLKKALAAQGFSGGTRWETEWSQWVQSEKEHLSMVMERHGFEWEHMDTHEKHLSVLDYKKQERAAEVKALEERLDAEYEEAAALEAQISQLRETNDKVEELRAKLDQDPDYQLPEPQPLMSARAYMTKLVKPLVDRLKKLLLNVIARYMKLNNDYEMLSRRYNRAMNDKTIHVDRIRALSRENEHLRSENRDYRLLRKVFGDEQIDNLLIQAWEIQTEQQQSFSQHQMER